MGQFPERDCLHDTTSPSRTCVCVPQLFPTECSSGLLVSLDINHPFIVSRLVLFATRLLPNSTFCLYISHSHHLATSHAPCPLHLPDSLFVTSMDRFALHYRQTHFSLSLAHTRTKVPAVDRLVICSSWQQREYHTLSFGPIYSSHTHRHAPSGVCHSTNFYLRSCGPNTLLFTALPVYSIRCHG